MSDSNDHDVLVTLVANVGNLKESEDNFHRDMKESLDDLITNYSVRLDAHANRFTAHEARFERLETSNTRQNFTLTNGIIILGALWALLLSHVFGLKP